MKYIRWVSSKKILLPYVYYPYKVFCFYDEVSNFIKFCHHMDSPCIKQTICKVLNRFQHGKYLVAYVLKINKYAKFYPNIP